MGDEPPSFDPCECIFSPAAAMRRLISLLRNSQSYCTDHQCFTNPPGPNDSNDTGMAMFYMLIVWVIIAGVLYLMRPQSLRDHNSNLKGHDDHSNNDGSPPPPAPLM